MKRFFYLAVITCFSINPLLAQVPLSGIVTVKNSRINAGKTEGVEDVQIEHPNAQTVLSSRDGRFTLEISDLEEGAHIALTVKLQGKYKDYVVVNEPEIKNIVLGRISPINIYIYPKDKLEQEFAELVGVVMQKYKEHSAKTISRLRSEKKELENKNDYSSARYREIQDTLSFIIKDEKNIFDRVKEYAETHVIENIDGKNENYVRAHFCFSTGELNCIFYYLREKELDKEYQEYLKEAEESRKEDQSTVSAKVKKEHAENGINYLIKTWMLLARAANLQGKYNEAGKYYEKALKADILNYVNIAEAAHFFNKIHQYSKAERYYLFCKTRYEQLAEENPDITPVYAVVLNDVGKNYSEQKNYSEAEKYFLKSAKLFETLSEKDSLLLPDLASVLNNLGLNYLVQKKYDSAEENFFRSFDIYHSLSENDFREHLPDIIPLMNNIADFNYILEKYTSAEDYYLFGLDYYEERVSDDPSEENLLCFGQMLDKMAQNHIAMKNYDLAEEYLERKVETAEDLVSIDPPLYAAELAASLNAFGANCTRLEKYDLSGEYLNESLSLWQELAAGYPDLYSHDIAVTLNNMGIDYHAQKKYDSADEHYHRSLKIYEALVAQNNTNMYSGEYANTILNLARNYADSRNYDIAEEYYARGLAMKQKLAEEEPEMYLPDLFNSLCDIATAYHEEARYDLAEKYFIRASETCQTAVSINPKKYTPLSNVIFFRLGINSLLQEKFSDAENYLTKSLTEFEKNLDENLSEYFPMQAAFLSLIVKIETKTNYPANYYKQLQRIVEKLRDKNASYYNERLNIALIFELINQRAGNNKTAEQYHSQVIEIANKYIEEDENNVNRIIPLFFDVIDVYREVKDYRYAIKYLEEIYRIIEKKEDKLPSYYLIRYYSGMSLFCIFTGDFDRAIESAQKGLEIDPYKFGIKSNLATALLFTGDYVQAESIYKEIAQIENPEKSNKTFGDSVLEDLQEFENAGIIPQEREDDVREIRLVLTDSE